MIIWLSSIFCRLFGWKVKGDALKKVPKAVIIVIPHTSNWDFPIGLWTRVETGKDIKFIAKDSIFRWPFGRLFRSLGGYPVDRSGNLNFVDSVVRIFDEHENFLISMSPEGTRKKVSKLKSGFYYIAMGAKVPIIMCKFDWANRVVDFADPFHPSGDYEKDLEKIREHFTGVEGKNKELGWLEH